MCPWCQSPSSPGPCIWQRETERQRELAKVAQKSILGWRIRKWTNERSLFVCLVKRHIMWFLCVCVCECKASSIWLWGSCPCREAQLKPGWHQSSVPVPWLTGCANRERTGRPNTRSCVCVGNATSCPSLSKPNSTWVRDANLPTSLSQWRRGHPQRHKKRRLLESVFCSDLKRLMEQWKRLPFTL